MDKLKPYSFQKEAIRFIESNRPPVQPGYGIIADDCGLGKSIDTCLISYAHLDEGSFLIVCTASMKLKWEREIFKWTGEKAHIIYGEKEHHLPEAKYYIINYHILGRENKADRKLENERKANFKKAEQLREKLETERGQVFKKNKYIAMPIRLEGWITELAKKNIIGIFPDECFVYDTLILTNKGLLKIGDIVTNKLNVNVISVDKQGRLDEKPILHYISKKITKRIVCLIHSFGKIICTENHLLWSVTYEKWKKVSEITSGESLCFLQEEVYYTRKRKRHFKILQSFLRDEISHDYCGEYRKTEGRTGTADNKDMFILQKRIQSFTRWWKKSNILFPFLRYKIQSKIREIKGNSPYKESSKKNIKVTKSNVSNRYGLTNKKSFIRKNENKQSRNESRYAEKNNSYEKKEWNFRYSKILSWWKWTINRTANIIKENIRKRLDIRIPSKNRNENLYEKEFTRGLQIRYRKSENKNRDRSRRKNAQNERFNQKRLFENESIRISRVESITFLELGYNGKSEENKENNYVYDLTIKDNHNYFAGGVLAHNCHRLANEKAIWVRSFIQLFQSLKPKIFVPLSGTITRKRPKNLFTILNLTAPYLFPNKYKFLYRYCDPKKTRFGWTFDGSTNEEELHKLLSKVMIRRLKSDVLKELPPRTFSVIPMELTKLEARNYSSLDNEYKKLINKQSLQAKNTYSELKLLAYLAKRNSVFNWIDEYLEDHDKLIIAAWHKKVINDLYDKYKHIGLKIDGGVPSTKRQEIEDKFQTDEKYKVIILQIDAGGEGITLTASNAIAIIEMPDTPGQLIQVSDRGHRIGLKSDTFTIYFPFADGTIENKIADEIENSYKSLEEIMDGKKGSGLFKYKFKNL